MLCPNCKTPLSIADRSQIEIDFCPTCRGVWLDRGELDKLIERASAPPQAAAPSSFFTPVQQPPAREPYGDRDDWSHHGDRKPHRRKSFLSEMFDFD